MTDHFPERVSAIFTETIGNPPVCGMATVPADVEGWDSLGHIRLVHALEQEFDCRLDDDALQPGPPLGSLVDALRTAAAVR